MKKLKGRNSILWIEGIGFSFLIVMTWLAEALKIPHYIFNEPFPFVPNWKRAILRTIVMIMIWAWVHFLTRRLLKRLHYLEDFLRICSWCRKVCHDDQWLGLEQFFNSRFDMRTSHGMCPECLRKKKEELARNDPRAKHDEKSKTARLV